jgi:diacylglycerol kinase (ATP)
MRQEGSALLIHQRLMCNYFSVGVESRIGLGFDKKRTNSAFCNKACYGWEGIKKMFCCCGLTRTHKVREVIDNVSIVNELGASSVVFSAEASPEHRSIRGDPVSFVCTNISSIMGG